MERPGQPLRVVVARNGAELEAHLPALENLAAAAMEPNVFYEPWVLIPALDAFGAGRDLWFLLAYAEPAGPGASATLCGFFPFERGRRFGGMPITVFRMWKYGTAYCGLCTPLLRDGHGVAALDALFAWAKHAPGGPALFEWRRFGGDGPVAALLREHLARNACASIDLESRSRPMLRRRGDADEFMRLAYSARHRATNGRKERRLAEAGSMEFYELGPGDDVDAWIEEFMRLESAGWKAGLVSAIAATDASSRFFRAVVAQGWRRKRVMILGLRLDGATIGAMCNLLSPPGSFLYKVAFDERFGRYSPGELLQQDNIRRVHARPEIEWMDSLAEPSFEHVYRWLDRREIRSMVVSTGRRGGDMALSLVPALRWIKARFTRGARRTLRAGEALDAAATHQRSTDGEAA